MSVKLNWIVGNYMVHPVSVDTITRQMERKKKIDPVYFLNTRSLSYCERLNGYSTEKIQSL